VVLDQGKALGRTLEAFKNRWFTSSYNGYGVVPVAAAKDEILEAVSHMVHTVRMEEWMTLDEPVVEYIRFDLPTRSKLIYSDMEKRMYAELGR